MWLGNIEKFIQRFFEFLESIKRKASLKYAKYRYGRLTEYYPRFSQGFAPHGFGPCRAGGRGKHLAGVYSGRKEGEGNLKGLVTRPIPGMGNPLWGKAKTASPPRLIVRWFCLPLALFARLHEKRNFRNRN